MVQERLLSLRTLHFGREQIAWECQTLRACETFPGEQPIACGSFFDVDLRFRLQYDVMNLVRKTWPKIAETYAGCHLTKETDKCIAISGIVEEIQLATTDSYFAGLWESSFVEQLCWLVYHLDNERQRRTRIRPLMYRAPSWSWLSIDGSVDFHDILPNLDILFDVLSVEIENTGPTKFGSIKGGFLIGRGVLKPAMWTNLTNDLTSRLLIDDQYIENGKFWGHFNSSQVTMDQDHLESCENVWCLPVLKGAGPIIYKKVFVIGLILVPAGRAENEYERVGGFEFRNEIAEILLAGCSDATHQVITIV